jgi:hypothetical protein
VLAEVSLVPDRLEPALLPGYDISIAPRANLVRSDQHSVYGVIASATHDELDRLYAHSESVLGQSYRPEAVLARTADGRWLPALCYIAHGMTARPVTDAAYVDRIIAPARALGFPSWYIERLEAFRPK